MQEHPGLIEIAYLIGPDPQHQDRLRLFRREVEIETNRGATEIRTREDGLVLLVDGLKEFHMEFLKSDVTEAGLGAKESDYLATWPCGFGADKLPAAVRMTMVVASEAPGGGDLTLKRIVRIPATSVAQDTHADAVTKCLTPGKT